MPRLRVPLPSRRLREVDIIPAVKEYVRRRHAALGSTCFTYSKEKQIGSTRADFSTVIAGKWEGFEIKSETDSLTRLRTQCPAYAAHFDRCWVVAHSKHFPMVYKKVPEWWGVMETWMDKGDVVLELRRGPGPNPDRDVRKLLDLFWKVELIEMAKVKGVKVKRRWNKWVIRQRVADLYTLEEVHRALMKRIVTRPGIATRDTNV